MGRNKTVCCCRTINERGVWQTTYRLDLFGREALKDILYDLNEFQICVYLFIYFFHEGGLISKLAFDFDETIYFLQNHLRKMKQNCTCIMKGCICFQFCLVRLILLSACFVVFIRKDRIMHLFLFVEKNPLCCQK